MSSNLIRSIKSNLKIHQNDTIFVIDSKLYSIHSITFRKARRHSGSSPIPPVAVGVFEVCEAFVPYFIESDEFRQGYFIYDNFGNLFWSSTEKLDPTGWYLIRRGKHAESKDSVHFSNFGVLTIHPLNHPDKMVSLEQLVHSYRKDDFLEECPADTSE